MRPLDVLFVLPSLEHGGAERVVVNLANALQRSGQRPRIVLTDRSGGLATQLEPSVPVVALERPRVRAALIRIVRDIRRDPPDVLVATHTHLNLALCAARLLLPNHTRLVIREPIHAPKLLIGRPTRWRRVAQRALYRTADLVLATSGPMLRDLQRLTGARVELLHNPVDVTALRSDVAAAADAPASTDVRTGRRFISVGRLTPQKLLPELLRAFAAGAATSDRLVIVGEGPLHDDVAALARALGVADRVDLLGRRERPWLDVVGADALVLASRDEGMPNVVLEALAVGTPVIATDELEVLRDLQAAAPDGAVRLVPHADLAAALRTTPPRPATLGASAATSLLPDVHASAVSGARFVAMLHAIVAEHGTR